MPTADGVSDTPASNFLIAARLADLGVFPNLLAKEAGIPGIPVLKWPQWVVRCGEKVSRALFPNIEQREFFAASGTTYETGFAFGLIDGGLRMLVAVFERLKPWPKMRVPTEVEARKALRYLFGEHGDWLFDVLKDDGAKFFEEVEDYESKMTITEAATYGQGKADSLKMVAGANKKNEATDIYLFMLLYWRVVERLESVDQLHQAIIKVFGSNLAGADPKRVAQICQRVGLKYRARGRPPKQPQRRWPLR